MNGAEASQDVFACQRDLPWITRANASGLTFRFYPEGGLQAIGLGELALDQGGGTPLEGSLQQVYLRRRAPEGGWQALPLTGPLAASRFDATAESLAWHADWAGLSASCQLRLHPREAAWCWTLRVRNDGEATVECDAVRIQDIGLAPMGALRCNEAYVSHYLDHHVTRDPFAGYVLRSRQNQAQGGRFPALVCGCAPEAVAYATDGFQFFSLDAKRGAAPAALAGDLPSQVLQYEMAAPAQQAKARVLAPGESADFHFWTCFLADTEPLDEGDHLDPAPWREPVDQLLRAPVPDARPQGAPPPKHLFAAPVLNGDAASDADLRAWFGPAWRHEETRGGQLLSFFHGDDQHVVLPAKELAVERPHGHIFRSGTELVPTLRELSATSYLYGAFLSYITLGNLSFNRFLSICRSPLNLQRAAGQRVFVRWQGGWRLLAMPSAFEIARSRCRWFYQLGASRVRVEASVAPETHAARLEIHIDGPALACLISHEVLAGQDFLGGATRWSADPAAGRCRFTPDPAEMLAGKFPDCQFEIRADQPADVEAWQGDEALYADGQRRGYPYAVVRTRPVNFFGLTLGGSLEDRDSVPSPAVEYWPALTGGLSLSLPGNTDVARLDDTLKWHAHAAMIHYLSPHGLEQYTGAAWGTRDVCQGPLEFLLALRQDDAARHILRTVFSHQYEDTALWPQWFMFDAYRAIQSRDSHGDVAIWPLKALCDYVETTHDFGLLDEALPYTAWPQADFTETAEPVSRHVERLLDRLESEFIPGASLLRYGHGDWDDTLQPCRREIADRLVSSWTVELLFQTLSRYAELSRRAQRPDAAKRAAALADRLREAFQRWLLPDGVVAGFALFPEAGGAPERYLLHPSDGHSGIRYRLLSMTRGILSGMFTPAQAHAHAALIEEHLAAPDGCRLMDRPIAYHGGRMRDFLRAETAANFGREIGIQYVHAHLRYLEAMARLGKPAKAWWALMAVTPVRLDLTVPNALPRQANSYFSSSDGAFPTRYEARRRYHDLQRGAVGAKGGWRVYSSGPGMFFGLTLTRLFGLRYRYGDFVIDPMLPPELDGLELAWTLEGKPVRIRYTRHDAPTAVHLNGQPLPTRPCDDNPYRPGGVSIPVEALRAALTDSINRLDIHHA